MPPPKVGGGHPRVGWWVQKAYRAGARGKYSKLSNQALTLGSQRLRMEGGLGSCGVSPWPDDDECSDRQNLTFPPLRGVNIGILL